MNRLILGMVLGFAAAGGVALSCSRGDAAAQEKESMGAIMERMKEYNKALGVDCDYCHVPNKFTIETPRSKTAKWMQEQIVDRLAEKEGTKPVTCLTCHAGRARFLPSSQ